MSYFMEAAERTPKGLVPGVTVRTFWGERTLLSLADLEPNAVIPPHSHPHEQIGMVIAGEMTMTIGDEVRACKVGTMYVIPGGTEHSVVTGPDGAQALEVFAPIREEYKFPN